MDNAPVSYMVKLRVNQTTSSEGGWYRLPHEQFETEGPAPIPAGFYAGNRKMSVWPFEANGSCSPRCILPF